jgi:hypothetical protein
MIKNILIIIAILQPSLYAQLYPLANDTLIYQSDPSDTPCPARRTAQSLATGNNFYCNPLTLRWSPFGPTNQVLPEAYNWSITNGTLDQMTGSLGTAGSNTLTFSKAPPGTFGSSVSHYLRISGGTGTAENVLITGGTCTLNSLNCTLIFTTVNTHTGFWSIGSATSGIQEAIRAACGLNVVSGTGGQVLLGPRTYTVYTTIEDDCGASIIGQGTMSVILPAFTSGNILDCNHTVNASYGDIEFTLFGFNINNRLGSTMTAGAAIHINNYANSKFSNINIELANDGMWIERCQQCSFSNIMIIGNGTAYKFMCSTPYSGVGSTTPSCSYGGQATNLYAAGISANTGTGLALYPTSGGMVISNSYFENNSFAFLVDASNGYGPINEVEVSNMVFDGCSTACFYMVPGAQGNSLILSNTRMAALGIPAVIRGSGVKFVNNVLNGATTAANSILFVDGATQFTIQDNTFITNNTASNLVFNTASTYGSITGNTYGYGGKVTPTYSVQVDGSANSNLFFSGNNFNPASAFTTTLQSGNSNWITPGQVGISIPSVASVAALVFPPYPMFTLTGTTGVTSVSGLVSGTSGKFVTSGAVTFTAGSTIANTITTSANQLVDWFFDGTKIYLH